MLNDNLNQPTPRRGFLGTIAAGAAALSLASLVSPFRTVAQTAKSAVKPAVPAQPLSESDIWFNKVKGRHRIVFDATHPNEIMPFVWPKIFLMTNAATGSPEADCGAVVILRHNAICYAFKDSIWEKYGFGDVFKANEVGPAFQAADAAVATKTRNPFWNTKPGDFKAPGFGDVPIGIKDLQANGIMFCVCNAAMIVFSNALAGKMNMKPEDVMKEWKEELIPGIQIVPSGVWAVGRAQEHGCKYCFAG